MKRDFFKVRKLICRLAQLYQDKYQHRLVMLLSISVPEILKKYDPLSLDLYNSLRCENKKELALLCELLDKMIIDGILTYDLIISYKEFKIPYWEFPSPVRFNNLVNYVLKNKKIQKGRIS